MADATAKYPNAALADFGGEIVGLPEAEWTLNTQILSGTAVPFSVIVNEAVSARVPTIGWLTLDNEILHYNALNTGTKTFTCDARAQQDTVAGQHDVGTWVGFAISKRFYNQVLAEILAHQAAFAGVSAPNLVLNSDFGRRTVFGLAMPEVFADTSGYVKVDGGTAPTVSANILTFGAANNNLAWCNQSFVWRDGRASATFKAVATAGFYSLKWRVDASNDINVQMNAGNFLIQKVIAGTPTTVATVAQALTLNRWYWLEIEKQGTTIIGKIYDTGGTASGVLKASSTLLQTLSGTVSDAGVQVGAHVGITSDQATAQWGGIATGNGGVYVETWLPESQVYVPSGTLGGMAYGFDEAVDSGPIGKQWAFRMYIPATSRVVQGQTINKGGAAAPSTTYTLSAYVKTSGFGGSGPLVRVNIDWLDDTGLNIVGSFLSVIDAAETSWTRKTVTATSPSTARYFRYYIQGNPSSTATGTAWVSGVQLEQGSAATAWRNAPADDAPIVWNILKSTDSSTTSASLVAIDERDHGINIFLPWDATVLVQTNGTWQNSGANSQDYELDIDTLAMTSTRQNLSAGLAMPILNFATGRLAAGKHRVNAKWKVSAGTGTVLGASYSGINLTVTATRGK